VIFCSHLVIVAACSNLDGIFERHAFRIVVLEPSVGRGLVGKNLKMVRVAHGLAGVDVNPDLGAAHENASITLYIAECLRFLTLTQLGDRPAR
jgi:hypothetical protein